MSSFEDVTGKFSRFRAGSVAFQRVDLPLE
jgi:hypothetical protein